jgi:hypothetical protein
LFTFGGTGCYGAAEAAKPGLDFDGSALTQADFAAGADYEVVPDNMDPAKVTLCRPGVRTMWDAMLSEGRKYWFFASSDWHNRGSFGPLDYETTSDFWPGEYQENFVWIDDADTEDRAQAIVDGLRSGNSFTVQGQLISGDLEFKACARHKCATMGETLEVREGELVRVVLEFTDPSGKNNSPYRFDNPSLLQIGKKVPLNEPELAQVDLIMGSVTGQIDPDDAEYFNPLAPATTHIAKTWDDFGRGWGHKHHRKGDKKEKLFYAFRATEDAYVRARGSNIPAGTPNERDAYGNPLADNLSDNIACSDSECPSHIGGILTADVEAWADIWFHTNPIFIEVK